MMTMYTNSEMQQVELRTTVEYSASISMNRRSGVNEEMQQAHTPTGRPDAKSEQVIDTKDNKQSMNKQQINFQSQKLIQLYVIATLLELWSNSKQGQMAHIKELQRDLLACPTNIIDALMLANNKQCKIGLSTAIGSLRLLRAMRHNFKTKNEDEQAEHRLNQRIIGQIFPMEPKKYESLERAYTNMFCDIAMNTRLAYQIMQIM